MSESHPEVDAFEAAGADTGETMFLNLLNKDAEGPSEEDERDDTDSDNPSDEDESDEDAENQPSEDDEDETEEAEHEDEDESEDEDDQPKKTKASVELSDDLEIVIPVKGENKTFTLAELKKLGGQHAAITQRSMELAETKKRADETISTYAASLNYLYAKAKEKADQYSDHNLLLWSKDLPTGRVEELIEEARLAKEDARFFEQEISQVSNKLQAEAAQRLRQDAEAAYAILSAPPEQGGIEGFGQKKYEDLMAFAIQQGIPRETALTLTDPGAWRIIDLAYKQVKGAKALETKTVPSKPAKPGRVIKGTPNAKIQAAKPSADKLAMKALRENGDLDSATSVFMSRMSRK